jgi:hypothetical protein
VVDFVEEKRRSSFCHFREIGGWVWGESGVSDAVDTTDEGWLCFAKSARGPAEQAGFHDAVGGAEV